MSVLENTHDNKLNEQPHQLRRSGRSIDSKAEARLIEEFGECIQSAPDAELPKLKTMILDKLDAWSLSAKAAYGLLCVIEQRIRPGHQFGRVTANGDIVPLKLF